MADLPELPSHVGHRLPVSAAAGLARAAVPPGRPRRCSFRRLDVIARAGRPAGGCRTTRGLGAAHGARTRSCDEHQREPDGESKASHVSFDKDGAASPVV